MNYRALLILSVILCTKVDNGHIFYGLCLHAKDYVSSTIKILSVSVMQLNIGLHGDPHFSLCNGEMLHYSNFILKGKQFFLGKCGCSFGSIFLSSLLNHCLDIYR